MSSSFFQNIDFLSYLSGFASAVVLTWLLRFISPVIKSSWKKSSAKRAANRDTYKLAVEYDYRNDVIKYVQGLHLAAPLFSLEEILVPPLLLAPPPQTRPGEDNYLTNTNSKILPYMPDFPEFASVFGAEKITLAEALHEGANVALMGPPGSGKTVTLAHFASEVASFAKHAGEFADYLPFYVHAAELQLPLSEDQDPFNAIYDAVINAGYLSRKTRAKLSLLIGRALTSERAIVLLDGIDEISPKELETFQAYIRSLLLEHPGLRIVAAVSSAFFGGLTKVGLHPMTVAGWTSADRTAFIKNWQKNWVENIETGIWKNSESGIEPHMLTNWLARETLRLTPLELTLRAWAVFAGDAVGDKNQHSIDAYLRRKVGNNPAAETALERFGMQMVLAQRPIIHERAATLWSRGQMIDPDDDDQLSEAIQNLSDEDTSPGRVGKSTISSLIAAGVLVYRGGEKISFVHPVLGGYYAGRGFANFGRAGSLAAQRPWSYREIALHYLAGQTEVGPLIEELERNDDVHAEILASGRWLRDLDPKSNNRMLLMRKLAAIFQDETQPAILRQRAIAALTLSNDPGLGTLCKKLLASQDPLMRSMCVLMLGYIKNEKYLPELNKATTDSSFVVRASACFALANFATKETLDTVATSLLHGDEDTQRAAAEALALDPAEGFELLLEASQEEDLLVRRSAIFGLGRTRREKALEIIKKLQLEDDQWVVRNAATQEILKDTNGSPSVPHPFEPLHNRGWLISFAGETGEGLAPGRAAADMLFRALVKGNPEQRLAAMDHYRLTGSDAVWTALHKMLRQAHGTEIHNAVVQTLWHLRAQGFATQYKEITAP